MKGLNVCAASAVFALASFAAQAQSSLESIDETPSAAAMAFDFVVVRPLGIVATVAGIGLFVAQIPLSIVQGEPPLEPAKKFIVEPAKYTFARPLGELE